MGLDLSLLTPICELRSNYWFCQSILQCDRHRVFDEIIKIEKVRGVRVTAEFFTYLGYLGDETGRGYAATKETPYGEALYYVLVEDLLSKPILEQLEHENTYYLNKSVWAYLAQLPKDMKVALFWS